MRHRSWTFHPRTLLLGLLLIPSAAPAVALAQESAVYDVAIEERQAEFPAELRRSLLRQTIDAGEVSLSSEAFDRVLEMFGGDPTVAIVLLDRSSGELVPARRQGRASFSVGPPADVPAACGRACADFDNPRRLRLEKAKTTVSAPGIGDIEVQLLGNADVAGAVDPATGRTYVAWPVIIRVPRGDTFERPFTKRVVFRGFGQLSEGALRVVDAARLEVPGGRTFDVIASHSVELPARKAP